MSPERTPVRPNSSQKENSTFRRSTADFRTRSSLRPRVTNPESDGRSNLRIPGTCSLAYLYRLFLGPILAVCLSFRLGMPKSNLQYYEANVTFISSTI